MRGVAATEPWRAILELRFQSLQGRTQLVHRRHEGPLLVQRAFYPERGPASAGGALETASEPCHLYLIHPPGGVASGDELELQALIGAGAHALLTTPAAGKFYRRAAAGTARLRQCLRVEAGVLEWLPQENIFYPDAAVEVSCIVRLSAGARFFGWEIGCLGLPTRGQTFQTGELRQCVELWLDDRPLLLEHVTIGADTLSARWGLAGRAALGSAWAYPAGLADLEVARAAVAPYCADMSVACTLVDDVLICRACAARADRLRQALTAAWRALRPGLIGREAVAPRIWAT